MSPGLSVEIHAWRGIGFDQQLSLFYFGLRLGFITISIQRDWVLDAYRKLRAVAEQIVAEDEDHHDKQR